MAREYFCAYHSALEAMEHLNDAERGRLFTACLQYSMTGETPELRGNERFVFSGLKAQIDRDKNTYDEKCRKAKNAIIKRWATDEYERIPPNTDEEKIYQGKDKGKGKGKDKDKDKEDISSSAKPPRTKFAKPTSDEVREYCIERKNGVDAQRFVDFYESKGWLVGKTPMKDWKAAVRNWEKNSFGGKTSSAKRDASYDLEELERLTDRGIF